MMLFYYIKSKEDTYIAMVASNKNITPIFFKSILIFFFA